eukprot:229720-Rhodomonas_salina.1
MADLMKMSPKHSQSMSVPSSSSSVEMDRSASAFSVSTSRVYDVFTALVEEDLGIKVSEDKLSTDAGPSGSGATGGGGHADA